MRPPLLWAALCAALLSGALPRPQPGRLAPGLRVAGVPVGGLDRRGLAEALARATAGATIGLRVGPRRLTATWDDLGLTLDEEATWRAAYARGHGPDAARAELEWLTAGWRGPGLAPAVAAGWRLAERWLRGQAEATGGPAGTLDVPATLDALRSALRQDLSPTLDCPLRTPPRPPTLRDAREVLAGRAAAPPHPAQAANWQLTLERLNGATLRPGARLCLNALVAPDEARLPFAWAPSASATGLLGRWGEGCEPALQAVARLAREAGLAVAVTPLAARWRGLLPAGAQYVLRNPSRQTWVLTVAADGHAARLAWRAGTAPPACGASVAPTWTLDRALVLAAVGDVQPMGAGAPRLPAALAEADLRLANLEAPLTQGGEPTPYKSALALATNREFLFRAAPDSALPLLGRNVDVVSLANNHALDYGPAAAAQTVALLRERGLAACGYGPSRAAAVAPVVGDCGGGPRVAFVAFAEAGTLPQPQAFAATETQSGLALLFTTPTGELTSASRELLRTSLRRAASAADVVVLAVHWGQEKSCTVLPYQRAIAREAVAAGADLVLGHHPHRLQPVALLSGRLVCYSLGNCLFPGAANAQARSAVLRVALGPRGQLRGAALVPYRLVRGNPQPVARSERPVLEAARADLGL